MVSFKLASIKVPLHNEVITKRALEQILIETSGRVNIRIRDEKLYPGNLENDRSYFMNNWNLIK